MGIKRREKYLTREMRDRGDERDCGEMEGVSRDVKPGKIRNF